MDIEVFDIKNQCVIGVFKVSIRGVNYQPTMNEVFEEAWRCAVEDNVADPNRKRDYSYKAL